MRSKFDKQLELLNAELIQMGALCESAIAMAARTLASGDTTLSDNVSETAFEISQKGRNIEAMCMRILLQQQPVAKDLRIVSSALKMITDMDRIGDNSCDIAEIILTANISAYDTKLPILDMGRATIRMVTESIDAFVKRNVNLAKEVISYDDVVDEYFDKIKMSLIAELEKSCANGEMILDLLMIAKYFERMSDHAVEIAKWVIFSITGHK